MRVYICALLFVMGPFSGIAQTAPSFIPGYANGILAELEKNSPVSVDEWTHQYTGDSLQTTFDQDSERSLTELEGRWCARSTASSNLEGGVTVRRIALFYPPLVQNLAFTTDIPPLPTGKGAALIGKGCHLQKVVYELQGIENPGSAGEAIASEMSPSMFEDIHPDNSNFVPDLTLLHNFHHTNPSFDLRVVLGSAAPPSDNRPSLLLIWEHYDPGYGESSVDIDPFAEQPWLAPLAAKLAALPQAPTLSMLSVLGGQVHCNTELVPVLRTWMALARKSSPQQHAAALVLANEVASRLNDCDEYPPVGVPWGPPVPGDPEWAAYHSLTGSLDDLGISMRDTRGGPKYEANLLDSAMALADKGPVGELERIDKIDDPCAWADSPEWPRREISLGESILSDFAPDDWTTSVHLILAEAYMTSTMIGAKSDPDASREKAIEHYRKYYALSSNLRGRAIVWQEIWNLQAGLAPRLRLPLCMADDDDD